MSFGQAIQAFNRIIAFKIDLNGIPVSIEELLIYFGFGALICYFLGGIFK